MADLFDQEGITFRSSSMASTHPSTTPDAIAAPNIQLPPQDAQPIASNAPRGQKNMSAEEQAAAMNELYGDGETPMAPAATPTAPELTPSPVQPTPTHDLLDEDPMERALTLTDINKAALNSGTDVNSTKPQDKPVTELVSDSDKQWSQLALSTGIPQETIDAWKSNPIGPIEAATILRKNQVLPFGDLNKLSESLGIKDIAERMKRKEDVSASDITKLQDFIRLQAELKLRPFTTGGKFVYEGAQLPAYLAIFVPAFGTGAAAAKVASKGIESVVARAAIKAAVTATVGSAIMLPQAAAQYGERQYNDSVSITDKGEVLARVGEESPAKSALLAFTHNSADILGQMAAGPIAGALKTPLVFAVNKVPVPIKMALYQAYKNINPSATISKVFTAAGWQGMISQLGANEVGRILHTGLNYASDKEYTADQALNDMVPDSQAFAVEAGLIGIAGGIHTSSAVVSSLMRARGMSEATANETVRNMSAIERENFVNEHLPLPQSDYPSLNTEQAMYELSPKSQDRAESQVIESQILSAQAKEKPAVSDDESQFNRFYREMVNQFQPFVDITKLAKERGAEIKPGEDPHLLSSIYPQNIGLIEHNLQVESSNYGADGNRVSTGKSLKSVMDDYDNYFISHEPDAKTRWKDFNDFLIAERSLEIINNDKGENSRITGEQQNQAAEHLVRMADKYGNHMQVMRELAQEVYDYQDRIVQNLVSSGVMSQEFYDSLKSQGAKYVPLQRVMDDPKFHEAIANNGMFTNADKKSVIKRLRGSDREVKDVFKSIIGNTAKVLDLAARNKVAQSVANLAPHLPEYIQKEKPMIVKKGTAEFEVFHDPILRQKLESLARYLGGDVERTSTVKGNKKAIGSYSPMEDLIRLRLGSTEGTLAHEVGHQLDTKLGLKKRLLGDKDIKEELQKLAEDRLGGDVELKDTAEGIRFAEERDNAGEAYMRYIRSNDEVLANMFDMYVNARDKLRAQAPKAFEAFENILSENEQKLGFIREIIPSTSRAGEKIKKDIFGASEIAPPKTITVFRNGQKEYYRVSKPLLEAMKGLTPAQITMTEKILAAPFSLTASTLRTGATLTPDFAIRNVLRDQHDAFLQSGVKYTPAWFIKGLFASVGHNDLYKEWSASGGKFNSYMSLDDKGLERAYQDLLNPKGRLQKIISNPFLIPVRLMAEISQTGEHATRAGVFGAAKEKGLTDIEAASASLEATLNFARAGQAGRKINKYVPFFNAGVQGIDKLVRTFKNNPKALTFWGIATITIPSLAIQGYYLNAASGQDRKEYLEIPQWQKDLFWVFKVDGEWKRYPKPFSYGYIFGSLPERVMLWADANDKPQGEAAWKDIMKGLAGTLSPINDWSSAIPPLLKAQIEYTTNWNFFRGRSIYPKWMEGLDPELQANKYTTQSARAIAKPFDLSPAKVENYITALTGGSGKYALDAGDKIYDEVRKWNGEKLPEKPISAADIPLIKAFAVRDPNGYSSMSSTEFFKNLEEVRRKHDSLGQYDGPDKAKYRQDNKEVLSKYKFMQNSYEMIKDNQKQIDSIYDRNDMSGDMKNERIKVLAERMTKIAHDANKKYNAANKAGN